jgi:transcription elongation factor Elf1
MTIEYVTNRDLESSSGEAKGKLKILKTKEEADAQVEFTCPECGATEKKKESWTEPFVVGEKANQKFNLKCGKCGFSMKILKLKKEVKKKK